jgi:hypothetical protein
VVIDLTPKLFSYQFTHKHGELVSSPLEHGFNKVIERVTSVDDIDESAGIEGKLSILNPCPEDPIHHLHFPSRESKSFPRADILRESALLLPYNPPVASLVVQR